MGDYNGYEIADPNSPATPKQIAYLTYRKQVIPRRLTKGQASKLIDSIREASDPKDYAYWVSHRRFLFPDVYYDEDIYKLYDTLYAHIRNTMRGGSKKLTQKKIISVIEILDKSQRGWDGTPKFKKIFIDKLRELYPGCCDEKSQTREHSTSENKEDIDSPPTTQNLKKKIIVRHSTFQTPKLDSQSGYYAWIWGLLILLVMAGLILWFAL